MKQGIISIKSIHYCNILNKNKTIEVRTTCPKEWKDYLSGKTNIVPEPMEFFIYLTKGKPYLDFDFGKDKFITTLNETNTGIGGLIFAKFTLKKVEEITQVWHISSLTNEKVITCYRGLKNGITNRQLEENSCLTHKELKNYIGWNKGYAWYIEDLVVFQDRIYELSDFKQKWIDCGGNIHIKPLTKAPQSWCYFEEMTNE